MGAPLLTIATPFSGREDAYWEQWFGMLRSLACDRRAVTLLWVDNSRSEEFHARLREAAKALDEEYAGVEVVVEGKRLGFNWRDPVLVSNQAAYLWRKAVPHMATDLILCLESDVLAPADAISRLMVLMGDGVAAASGVVPYLWEGTRPIYLVCDITRRELFPDDPVITEAAYDVTWRTPPNEEGAEQVGAVGFGCLLARRSALTGATFRTDGAGLSYDQQFCLEARERAGKTLVDWGVRCRHLKRDADGELFELVPPSAGEPWNIQANL